MSLWQLLLAVGGAGFFLGLGAWLHYQVGRHLRRGLSESED